MPLSKFPRLSAWDLAYALNLAIASLITFYLMHFIVPPLMNRQAEAVGTLWAVISTVFVFRDTRAHSFAAGMARLIATFVSFALCFAYLLLFPANPLALLILVAVGTLVMMLLDRRDDIGLAVITTAVVMIVAINAPQEAWEQPLLRLADTVVGVAVGMACKWIASFLFYRLAGEEVR